MGSRARALRKQQAEPEKPGEPTSAMPPVFMARLLMARTAKKWTGEQAAKRCKVGRSRYYSWESGWREPRASDMPRIASALGVSVAWLYGESSV
jgi:transcriptional regulator with XRE-family HTH domain